MEGQKKKHASQLTAQMSDKAGRLYESRTKPKQPKEPEEEDSQTFLTSLFDSNPAGVQAVCLNYITCNTVHASQCLLATTTPVKAGGTKNGKGEVLLLALTGGRLHNYAQANIKFDEKTYRLSVHHVAICAAGRPLSKKGEEYHHRCFHTDCVDQTHIVVIPQGLNLLLNYCQNGNICTSDSIKQVFNISPETDISCLNH